MTDPDISTVVLSFKFCLLPNKRQHAALAQILEDQRILYNAALQERIDCYRKTGRTISFFDQCKSLTEWRSCSDASRIPRTIQTGTLKRIDLAYAAFFRRVKTGSKAGFPRFMGPGRWASFTFSHSRGMRIREARLYFRGLPGGLRMHLHRPLPEGRPLACQFRRDAKGWSICLQYRVPTEGRREPVRQVALDMGLSSLAVLDDGTAIPNIRAARSTERRMRITQRALARCKRGSKRRLRAKQRLGRLYARIANTRSTYLHQVSAKLVYDHDLIAIEALNVKGLAKGMLARSVHDAAWGKLTQYLRYKAEKAGCSLIEVNPKNTTQACSSCGVIVPKRLKDRWHDCPDCGLSLDRDHNAARNILHLAVAGEDWLKVAECRVPANENINRSSAA